MKLSIQYRKLLFVFNASTGKNESEAMSSRTYHNLFHSLLCDTDHEFLFYLFMVNKLSWSRITKYIIDCVDKNIDGK